MSLLRLLFGGVAYPIPVAVPGFQVQLELGQGVLLAVGV